MGLKGLYLAACLAVLPGMASASVVLNGSFESDPGVVSQGANGHGRGAVFSDLPNGGRSWGIWTSGVEGWSAGSNGIEFQTGRTLNPDLTPSDGNYYVELDTRRNSQIYQSVGLSQGRYRLSFDYAPRVRQADSNGINVTLDTLVNQMVTGSYTGGPRSWTSYQFDFNVQQAGEYTLDFAATGRSNSLGGLLDNVELTSVPVPASWLLLGTALAGFGALRRARKSA